MSISLEGAVRAAGVGVSGMYAGLFSLPTKMAASGTNNAAQMTAALQQKAQAQPSTLNSINAGLSGGITTALKGVTEIGMATTNFFGGLAKMFAGGGG